MKKVILLILLHIVFQLQASNEANEEDYTILNTVFPSFVIKSPQNTKEEYSPNNFPKVDTVKFKNIITKIYFTPLLSEVKKGLFKNPIDSIPVDVSSNGKILFTALINSNTNKTLDLNKLTNTGFYQIISYNNQKQKIGEHRLTFSNIIYDKSKTEACFYFEDNCAGLCAYGDLVFLKKINGIWKVSRRIEIWLS
jgi:hypothetical protein